MGWTWCGGSPDDRTDWFLQEPSTGAAGEGFASSSAARPAVRQAPAAVLLSWLSLGGLG